MTENTSNNSPKQKPFHINSYSFIHNEKTPKNGGGGTHFGGLIITTWNYEDLL